MSELPMHQPDDMMQILQEMRAELSHVGVKELLSPEAVDKVLPGSEGTTLLVVNSVCGCAAGNARPGVALALQNDVIPNHLYAVFAGQDPEATQRAREHMAGQPPSSPSVFLFKDGKLEFALHRHQIEGRTARLVAYDLINAFKALCAAPGPSVTPDVFARTPSAQVCGSAIPTKEEMEREAQERY